MTEGTKSYLIGCHQFFFHPLWVLMGWKLEYKSWPKWWQIICIFLHDVGICGRQYLSNDDAKIGHWKKGAYLSQKFVYFLREKIFRGRWKTYKVISFNAFDLCAGHCPKESGFPESKLFRADKRSWLVAPIWWLWCNYLTEWYGNDFGVTFYDASTGWKQLIVENLKSKNPIGSHELYLRERNL